MFDSWPQDSTGSAPQYEPNIFVTMATYWVPDLQILKAFLTTFSSVLIFANGASSALSNKHINMLGQVDGLV